MKLRLDPRAKLFLLVLSNLTLFLHVSLRTEIMLVVLLLSLYFLSGKTKSGLRMTAVYLSLVAADLFVIPIAEGFVLNFLSMLSVGIRMMLPCVISGGYAFSTTTVGEMVCAMRKLKIPEVIIIPCVTVVRFFPTIAEDYRHIRNAMALRGIATGNMALLRHPVQSLEYILIPLLMNSNNVAQDLSVASMTKGISMPGVHTSMTEIKMTKTDYLYMVLCTIPFVLFLGGVM
ncbi:MAG: energy-coupling factor transporter transmembrane protein EcfT [Oscillospiraceae bacterium]|nr:energy-coupling factor transporter transmembrane protein EcfT [Oscillospiraceae bacterium]